MSSTDIKRTYDNDAPLTALRMSILFELLRQ